MRPASLVANYTVASLLAIVSLARGDAHLHNAVLALWSLTCSGPSGRSVASSSRTTEPTNRQTPSPRDETEKNRFEKNVGLAALDETANENTTRCKRPTRVIIHLRPSSRPLHHHYRHHGRSSGCFSSLLSGRRLYDQGMNE